MIIRQIELKDFRGLEGQRHYTFAPQLTAIAGVNGQGKTALLEAIALLLSRFLRKLDLSTGNQRAIFSQDIRSTADAAELSMEIVCGAAPFTFRQVRKQNGSRAGGTRMRDAVKHALREQLGLPRRGGNRVPIAAYYSTDRAGFRLPRGLPETVPTGPLLANQGALVNRMVDYRDLMARFRTWQEEPGQRALRAFHETLSIFLTSFHNLQVDPTRVRMTLDKDALALTLPQLSDGERSFVALVADIVRRLSLANPTLEDLRQGRGIVLIDELELHLHPTWQKQVCNNLRRAFPNLQVITTTHSPFVIQSLRPGELINLNPEEFDEYSDRSIEDIAENVMGVRLPQKSERYIQMMDAAEAYYGLLRDPAADAEQLRIAEDRLNDLSTAYGTDPAFRAMLKLESMARQQGGEHEAR